MILFHPQIELKRICWVTENFIQPRPSDFSCRSEHEKIFYVMNFQIRSSSDVSTCGNIAFNVCPINKQFELSEPSCHYVWNQGTFLWFGNQGNESFPGLQGQSIFAFKNLKKFLFACFRTVVVFLQVQKSQIATNKFHNLMLKLVGPPDLAASDYSLSEAEKMLTDCKFSSNENVKL